MPQFINGFCIGGYRSFRDPQYIGPLTKVNVFAGPNNCGKSNILRFVVDHLPRLIKNPSANGSFAALDNPLGSASGFVMGLALSRDDPQFKQLAEKCGRRSLQETLEGLFSCECLTGQTPGAGLLWFPFAADTLNALPQTTIDVQTVIKELGADSNDWRTLWNLVRPNLQGGDLRAWAADVLHQGLSPFKGRTLDAAIVPAIRQVLLESAQGTDFSGRGLIERLADLQHPEHDKQVLKDRFRAIEKFLKNVTENASATLEIPNSKKYITVNIDGKPLPLEHLGTGLHEVIILAAAATILEKHVVCLEEPEIHLHPIYQRKLLKYLYDNTDNQYLIATHSAHILDAPECTVFHVALENGATRVRQIISSHQRWNVARELGAKASDVVQSNSAIWVEGPSDRIYLQHWIAGLDPSLLEGVHYSILFYGGKILAHHSACDPDVTEFVSMVAANRNSAVVMDRDRDNGDAPLNATKERIKQELSAHGYCWVTAGREIENYIPPDDFRRGVTAVAPNAKLRKTLPRYAKWLPEGVDKVELAKSISSGPAQLSLFDLREKILGLISFIRSANHLSPLKVADPEQENVAGTDSRIRE